MRGLNVELGPVAALDQVTYTEGRLTVEGDRILDERGYPILEAWPNLPEATVRRAAACWNALLDITTEQIEDGAFTKMREDRDGLLRERDDLLLDRRELVGVLRQARAVLAGGGATWGKSEMLDKMAGLLAKHEGRACS